MNNLDYSKVFEVLVKETANYVKVNNLKAMVLGISGGIDSTVVAAICHEVSKQTGIPLIGRSLPIKNKSDEFDVSKLVGEAFCDDFSVYRPKRSYRAALFDACADALHVLMCIELLRLHLLIMQQLRMLNLWMKLRKSLLLRR